MKKLKINKIVKKDFQNDSERAFGFLYEHFFDKTKHYITKNNGSKEDAEDIFQTALIILYEKLYDDHFETKGCVGHYLLGICKNLWLNNLRNHSYNIEFPDEYYLNHKEEINTAIDNEIDYLDKLNTFISKISSHCQNLIHDIFFKNKDISEIQEEYNYSTKHNARNQKYKCVEQIKKVKMKYL